MLFRKPDGQVVEMKSAGPGISDPAYIREFVAKYNPGWAEVQGHIDQNDRPAPLAFSSLLDRDGKIGSNFQLKEQGPLETGLNNALSNINLNTQGLEELRKRALGTGPSTWESLMMEKQGEEEKRAGERSSVLSDSSRAQSFADLAMRGGLSAGAKERLSRGAGRDALLARQGVLQQGIADRLGIKTTAENQKLDILKALPGMEVAALEPALRKTSLWADMARSDRAYSADVQKTNIDNALKRLAQEEGLQKDMYAEQMKAWAANKQADATAASGK